MRKLHFPLLLLLLLQLSLAQPAASQGGSAAGQEDAPAVKELSTRDQHYDRIEWFNEKMFAFNSAFDHFVLKPVALTYGSILPTPAQDGVRRAINNLDVVRKVVNNTLQGRPVSASRELARFLINSTVGIAGIFDMATKLGLEPSDQDMGITLGVYGISHGAYLVLPLLPPTTFRDGVGMAADSLMNPLGYFAPYYVPLSVRGVDIVNNRALNNKVFEELERSIDPYSSARNAYLQIRQGKLQAAREAGY
ncbi:MAG: VacJ family lipoprotein [Deltaproteobacteria bacterium]|nr:VacJ family lipoprotein [Deltaproteobacteria bacterium]